MKRGLNRLATISSIAPFIGVFGTLLGIANSFPAIAGESSINLGGTSGRLAESLVPAALGLLTALFAFCCNRCLLSQLNDFGVEMENASLQLISALGHLRS
jgi:biopolymer transport protein ExbB/TolQ